MIAISAAIAGLACFAPVQKGQAPESVKAIEKSVEVSAPISEVWNAWTTVEGLRTFLCPDAEEELKPHGRYEIRFDPSQPEGLRGSEGAQILSFVPQKMISFSWNAPPSLPEMRNTRTFVVVSFTPLARDRTRIDLYHAGWKKGAGWDQAFSYFDQAWGLVLGWCKERFEKGPRDIKPVTVPKEAPKNMIALDKLSTLIGGVWRGEVKGPEGPLIVEFVYKRHPDGIGVIGSGEIGKGSKNPIRVTNQFGWDPVARAVYYLDSHDSGTVFWGHVQADKDDLIFVFGPAGGDMSAFISRSRLVDKDTLQNIIKDSEGKDVVGFTLKRIR